MIAKRKAGVVEEKRGYHFTIRPASKQDAYHYGYGSMQFIIHGQELSDLAIDLGDDVDVLVVKKGAEYASSDLEEARHQLYTTQEDLRRANEQLGLHNDGKNKERSEAVEWRGRAQALQIENVRLLTELTTLKTMLQTGGNPTMIDGNRS